MPDDSPTQQILDARRRALDSARTDALAEVRAAGRMTARERVCKLVDAGSFVEYGVLAGETSAPDDPQAADGLVAGSGLVEGRGAVVASYDRSIRAGTQSDRNERKLARLVHLAHTHRWPLVCFADGDGARPNQPLPPPPIVVTTRGRWGTYDGLAELSGWTPTVAVVAGRALDGHAGMAMLSECVIATRGSSMGSWSGHDGELVLRSVEDHAACGNVDLIVDDDDAAVGAVRRYLSYFSRSDRPGTPSASHDDISAIIPDNRRRPYDMRRVIGAFADRDSTLELGAGWGRSMLTVLARLGGREIGIFANQPKSRLAGAIDSDAADKAARFVALCDAYDLPLVSFIDNPGYMVGPQAEAAGIARHHARPLMALHHRTVPLYSVQLRKAYGLGPYAMSGWGTSRTAPDLRLAWPTVESGGMSLEGAAFLVKRKEIQAASTPAEALAIRDAYAQQMRDSASGLRAGRSFAFDDIVTPDETRDRIIAMLDRTPRPPAGPRKHAVTPR